MSRLDKFDQAVVEAESFNLRYPVGAKVRYWPLLREGAGIESTTRLRASVVGDTACVWVDGRAGCIALSHVEVLS